MAPSFQFHKIVERFRNIIHPVRMALIQITLKLRQYMILKVGQKIWTFFLEQVLNFIRLSLKFRQYMNYRLCPIIDHIVHYRGVELVLALRRRLLCPGFLPPLAVTRDTNPDEDTDLFMAILGAL